MIRTDASYNMSPRCTKEALCAASEVLAFGTCKVTDASRVMALKIRWFILSSNLHLTHQEPKLFRRRDGSLLTNVTVTKLKKDG